MTTSAQRSGAVEVAVLGIGAIGPGLASWAQAAPLLREPAGWVRSPTVVPPPQRLPATERRRAGTVVKASIVVADEALAMAGVAASEVATVFTSSTGDPLNCHLLCEALATSERMVSPTRFTNSVHNAPAGYWHIAAGSMAPSTSLAAYDASFAAGLLEAAVQVQATQAPVLLVACDVPYPEPLHSKRPVADSFGVALLLGPTRDAPASAAWLGLACGTGEVAVTACADEAMDRLRREIPAARALPLLQALAGQVPASVVLDDVPGAVLHVQLRWPE